MDGADTIHNTGTATVTTIALTLTVSGAGSPLILDYSGTYAAARHITRTVSVHGTPGSDNPLDLERIVN
jgi:hypothetical protein